MSGPFVRVLPPGAVRRRQGAAAGPDPGGPWGVLAERLAPAEAGALGDRARALGLPAQVLDDGRAVLVRGHPEELGLLPEWLPGPLMAAVKGALGRSARRTFTLTLPGGGGLQLGGRVLVTGIVNVTPDSFSDGGRWLDPRAAVDHGLALAAEGADLLDVGGESTRPGAAPADEAEELARVLPVIERLAAGTPVPVSVDTRRGIVAREALGAGAKLVNDVSALADPETARAAAGAGAPVVLMHMRGTPADMRNRAVYRDVVGEVVAELHEAIRRAVALGVPEESLLVDPGIGFAKDAAQSLRLLADLPELRVLGRPILVGPSRKSFLDAVRPSEPADRLHLTLGAVAACAAAGAHVVRVHDVRPAVDVLRAFEAARGEPGS
ncbi:MAG: dihydropteroate synthase [Planctomycetes bacterium]|jgi:dihydropteroate synthase|nr:dihydropteroate synthase [Planctomycetota bacterium]